MAKARNTKIQNVYRAFNSLYFRSKLPDIPVIWSNSRQRDWNGRTVYYQGELWPKRIMLKRWLMGHPNIAQMILLHEMVHVEQSHLPHSQAHGNAFHRRMKQLAQRGAFRRFW
jgi:hypothetical protein